MYYFYISYILQRQDLGILYIYWQRDISISFSFDIERRLSDYNNCAKKMVGGKSLLHRCVGIIIWTNCFVNGIFHKLLEMFKDLRVPNKILKQLKQQGNFSPIQAMKIARPWKISNEGLGLYLQFHDFPRFFSCQSLAEWLWHHLSSDPNQTMSSMDDQDLIF